VRKSNQNNIEAWNVFIKQMDTNTTIYPALLNEAGIKTMEKSFARKT